MGVAELASRGQVVMGTAPKGEVFDAVLAAHGEPIEMMELDLKGRVATYAVRGDERASVVVPFEDCTANVRGHVTATPLR